MFTRCRPLSRARVLFLEFDPGACAPGFMLSPASRALLSLAPRALLASASQAERILCKAFDVQRLYPADRPDKAYFDTIQLACKSPRNCGGASLRRSACSC